MTGKDLDLAGRVAEAISHFPDAWREYQDWLRDIVSSRSVLIERYPQWQAVLIFRWRLFYFVAYVALAIFFHQRLKQFKGIGTAIEILKTKLFPEKIAIAFPGSH